MTTSPDLGAPRLVMPEIDVEMEEAIKRSLAEPVLGEEEAATDEATASEEMSPAERGLEAAQEIRELAERLKDTEALGGTFPYLQFKYGMTDIGFAGRLPDTPVSVRFKINPQFEVQLTGGHAVEMRSEGSGAGASSAPTVPTRTRVQWKPGTLTLQDPSGAKPDQGPFTVGRQMQAEPLSQDHATGSNSTADSDQKGWMAEFLPRLHRRKGGTGSGTGNLYYIRGHLLNDNLGGIANEANLYPITNKANGQHKSFVEEFIKKGIDKGFVYSYSVEVEDKGFGYDPEVPKQGSTPAGAYTVDAELHFEFGRLDTAGEIIPETRHQGVIESRYGATGTKPFGGDKATEFEHDFPGGSPSAATAAGSEVTLETPQAKPVGSNAGLSSTVSSFSFAPVVSSLAPFASGQKIAPSATLVPLGNKLSLKQSTKANVVNYFTQLVQGWNPTDIDAWYTAVTGGASPSSTWKQIRSLAIANNLNPTPAATIFQTKGAYLTRVSINGAAVNT